MESRLDKLLLIRENGQNALVRTEAATQISQIYCEEDENVLFIIDKVRPFVSKSNWETRKAASKAIGMLCTQHSSRKKTLFGKGISNDSFLSLTNGYLNTEFDFENLVKNGTKLLGSSGKEYDVDYSLMSRKDRLKFEKANAKKKLGLDNAFDDTDLIQEEDFIIPQETKIEIPNGLSARERNALKRKARKEQKTKKAFSPVKIKKPKIERKEPKDIPEYKSIWLFQQICDELSSDLLSPNWIERHGAASCFLEIFKCDAKLAGTVEEASLEQNTKLHATWCLDLCIRLVSVLVLDRFSDFSGDLGVSPVKETVGQSFAYLLQYVEESNIKFICNALCELISSDDWAIRQGCMLGLKYAVALNPKIEFLVPQLQSLCYKSLEDVNEDVRHAAGEILLSLETFSDPDQLSNILWDCILEYDELSASTNSIMKLLTVLHSKSSFSVDLNRAERLVPYFRHALSSVRECVLKTLDSLVEYSIKTKECFSSYLLETLMLSVFQFVLLETSDLGDHAVSSFKKIMTLGSFSPNNIQSILNLLAVPERQSYSESDFLIKNSSIDLQFSTTGILTLDEFSLVECKFRGSILFGEYLNSKNENIQSQVYNLLKSGMSNQIFVASLILKGCADSESIQYLKACLESNFAIDSVKGVLASTLAFKNEFYPQILKEALGIKNCKLMIDFYAQGFVFCVKEDPSLIEFLSESLCAPFLKEYDGDDILTLTVKEDVVPAEGYLSCFKYLLQEPFENIPALKGVLFDTFDGKNTPLESLILFSQVVQFFRSDALTETSSIFLSMFKYLAMDSKVRYFTTQCITGCVSRFPQLLESCIVQVVNLNENLEYRRGCIELIYHLLKLDAIIPFVVLLVVPVLARMNDSDVLVRNLASNCFAHTMTLVSLDSASSSCSPEFEKRKEEERKFIEQLTNVKKIDEYPIPINIRVELREYQKEGVSWLGFLKKFHLNGALCDDMGLGKTLQTLVILSSEQTGPSKPSLVICPPSVIGHWMHEIKEYTELNALLYSGPPDFRSTLAAKLDNSDVVVVSYDILRNDARFFRNVRWNYIVLDEGHIIKNSKSKLTLEVKSLASEHRLILSGTPIQNTVLELWSIFDFLMPGFLGTEKQFIKKYAKPILASKESKATKSDQVLATRKLDALHKQLLPFILRRMKQDVLKDLPPKIIQDCYCEMSAVQQSLYSKYEERILNEKKGSFETNQYLRSLANHPVLVMKDEDYLEFGVSKEEVMKLENAPKLVLLKQLLEDCGIGSDPQHKVLIFFQLKSMLNIVEQVLLKSIPNASYLRLDGSIEASDRFNVVQRFNSDPSIDLMLLTTHVGGLGLNLTSADTVIFVEHDWNPMRDLQAMDRAHRLGQKKTVNVYRLLTRGSVEDKIMNLQKFKMHVAHSIVNQQNTSLQTMQTDAVLDLVGDKAVENGGEKKDTEGKNEHEEVWDSEQYKDYDLENFIGSI